MQPSRQIEGSSSSSGRSGSSGTPGEQSESNPSPDRQPLDNEFVDPRLLHTTDLMTQNEPLPPNPCVDQYFIVMHSMNTFAAFQSIATVLDLQCTPHAGFHIRALIHTLPPSIVPTKKQQIVPHRTYIDMLPWSSVRDRILNAPTAINEIEFTSDMQMGDLKIWGMVPWDPMAWELGEEFVKKWWFLIDSSMLQTTNFWRSQRGEKRLTLPS